MYTEQLHKQRDGDLPSSAQASSTSAPVAIVWKRRKLCESQAKRKPVLSPRAGDTGGLPTSVRLTSPCPPFAENKKNAQLARSRSVPLSLSLSICLSHPHLSRFFTADDVCVRQAPGRPNPLRVYASTETAEKIRSKKGTMAKVKE
ncbi:unnamed protein product [Pleuronectes platessa]|uniref:Uncharacterized protein n=1 Tax=Pleuronectes platessa TaxID=8262 RepID=A0A9N7Y9H7_PLEPL|nr:unnamed protein product [Pleuronectes platessa]